MVRAPSRLARATIVGACGNLPHLLLTPHTVSALTSLAVNDCDNLLSIRAQLPRMSAFS